MHHVFSCWGFAQQDVCSGISFISDVLVGKVSSFCFFFYIGLCAFLSITLIFLSLVSCVVNLFCIGSSRAFVVPYRLAGENVPFPTTLWNIRF